MDTAVVLRAVPIPVHVVGHDIQQQEGASSLCVTPGFCLVRFVFTPRETRKSNTPNAMAKREIILRFARETVCCKKNTITTHSFIPSGQAHILKSLAFSGSLFKHQGHSCVGLSPMYLVLANA